MQCLIALQEREVFQQDFNFDLTVGLRINSLFADSTFAVTDWTRLAVILNSLGEQFCTLTSFGVLRLFLTNWNNITRKKTIGNCA